MKGVARQGDAVRNESGAARSLNFQTRSLLFESERDFPLLNAPQCVSVRVYLHLDGVRGVDYLFLFVRARDGAGSSP